jgi:hypothetical protein
MIQLDGSGILKMSVHRIAGEEGSSLLNDTVHEEWESEQVELLKKIFLKPFTSHHMTFEFRHEVNLDYNPLFQLAKNLQSGTEFLQVSQDIARHLLSCSKHPNIKEGDFYVVHFVGVKMGEGVYEALGLFKFEDKDTYLETGINEERLEVFFRKGLGSRKPDKACLVVFSEEPYTLLIIDSNNNDTDYWQHEFIKHRPKNDHVNHTNNYLSIAKNFITEQMPQEFVVSKADQIDLLNRSVEYFKTHDTFDKSEFMEEVYHHGEMIDSFQQFEKKFQRENQLELSESFEISDQAVKKQARIFKSVIKLDRNFHIYIHGNKELIEQGVEKDGRKFYKIYYSEET